MRPYIRNDSWVCSKPTHCRTFRNVKPNPIRIWWQLFRLHEWMDVRGDIQIFKRKRQTQISFMKIRDISPILFAGAASLLMAASTGAAPLQQDLDIPLRPGPRPDDAPTETREPQEPDEPGRTPIIRPGGQNRLPLKSFSPPTDLEQESDQAIMINSQFAGWESASDVTSGKRIDDDTLRGNWIMVDATGRFDGQVVAGKNADVTNMNIFLMHMGRLVKQTTVDSEGQFVFNNVRQGAYALVGWGERGFFSFGLDILANNPNVEDNVPPNSVTITAYQNQTSINIDWIRYYAPQVGFRVFGRYPQGEGAKSSPALYGEIGLFNYPPSNRPATSISSHVVNRTPDGRLVGRVHQLTSISGRPVDLRSTKVLLLENDSVVAATASDNYGVFEFEQVPKGSYGVLAAGVDGVGLIGITVGDDDEGTDLIDFTLIPSETVGWLNDYATEVGYRRNIAVPRRPKPQNNLAGGCPNCNGQANGCAVCRKKYLESVCRHQGITFEQWQMFGCQSVKSGFGDGRFVREIGKTLRKGIDRVDNFSENAFTPEEGTTETLNELTNLGLGQNGVVGSAFADQDGVGRGTTNQGFGISEPVAPSIPFNNFPSGGSGAGFPSGGAGFGAPSGGSGSR